MAILTGIKIRIQPRGPETTEDPHDPEEPGRQTYCGPHGRQGGRAPPAVTAVMIVA